MDPNWFRRFDPDRYRSLGLVVPNPLRNQALAVTHDVRLGDTPENDPAIWWTIPPFNEGHVTRHDWKDGGSVSAAFRAFRKLEDAQRHADFVRFVQRFGPLGLAPYRTADGSTAAGLDYWVPTMVNTIMTPRRFTEIRTGAEYEYILEHKLLGILYEPISEYRRWSKWLNGVIAVADKLKNGGVASRSHWANLDLDWLFDHTVNGWEPQFPQNATVQRIWLGRVVQERFVRWSGIAPVFHWMGDKPEVALTLAGPDAVTIPPHSMSLDWPENMVFPAITATLMALLAGHWNRAVCSLCGKDFETERKPRDDQPHYCDDCKVLNRKEIQKKSSQKRRDRIKEERKRTAELKIVISTTATDAGAQPLTYSKQTRGS